MRFVFPVVFYEKTNIECVFSSSTTIFIGIIYCLHKVQLHVSALDNGHYQAPKHVAVPYVENTSYSTVPINIFVLDENTHSALVINFTVHTIFNIISNFS